MRFPWFRKERDDEPIELPHPAQLPDEHVAARLDVYSPTWMFITAWAEKHLDELRRKNDSPSKGEVETAVLRGQIKEIKALLDLPNAGRKRPGILTDRQDAGKEM